tara:strand:+ start:198 stop:455 length:258 start_codon:yes stop_codon:yes gene_type:complete
MLKRITFNKKELEVLIEGLERQEWYMKRFPKSMASELNTAKELLGIFKDMSKNYKEEKPFDISPRVKKAREEYDKIFFEKYGVKK